MNNLFSCGHCGNTTIMVKDAEAQKTDLFPYEDYNGQYTEGEEHTIHRILSCPVCGGITLVRSYWNDEMEDRMQDDFVVQDRILYPVISEGYSEVPIIVNNAYKVALNSRYLDLTICMIALRRTVEIICKDKGITGGMLGAKLRRMAEAGIIPPVINDASHIVKDLGNEAAHGDDVTHSQQQVNDVVYFVDHLINYIYVLPEKISRIQTNSSPRNA